LPEAENNLYDLTEVQKYALADDGHWQMKSWQDETQEIAKRWSEMNEQHLNSVPESHRKKL